MTKKERRLVVLPVFSECRLFISRNNYSLLKLTISYNEKNEKNDLFLQSNSLFLDSSTMRKEAFLLKKLRCENYTVEGKKLYFLSIRFLYTINEFSTEFRYVSVKEA